MYLGPLSPIFAIIAALDQIWTFCFICKWRPSLLFWFFNVKIFLNGQKYKIGIVKQFAIKFRFIGLFDVKL